MSDQSYDSVWDALEDSPKRAQLKKERSQRLMEIQDRIRAMNVSNEEAAQRLGLSKEEIDALLAGRVSNYLEDAILLKLVEERLAQGGDTIPMSIDDL